MYIASGNSLDRRCTMVHVITLSLSFSLQCEVIVRAPLAACLPKRPSPKLTGPACITSDCQPAHAASKNNQGAFICWLFVCFRDFCMQVGNPLSDWTAWGGFALHLFLQLLQPNDRSQPQASSSLCNSVQFPEVNLHTPLTCQRSNIYYSYDHRTDRVGQGHAHDLSAVSLGHAQRQALDVILASNIHDNRWTPWDKSWSRTAEDQADLQDNLPKQEPSAYLCMSFWEQHHVPFMYQAVEHLCRRLPHVLCMLGALLQFLLHTVR